jgi:hypothetical protein
MGGKAWSYSQSFVKVEFTGFVDSFPVIFEREGGREGEKDNF